MNRRFLLSAAKLVLIFAACAQLPVLATPAAYATVTAYQQGTLCKYEAAGIQFMVPSGWELAISKDGDPTLSRQAGASYYVSSFGILPREAWSLTPEQQFSAAQEGALSSAKKDFKGMQMGKVEDFTQNGIRGRRQAFTGKFLGADTVGAIILLSAERPVIIYIQVNAGDFAKDSRTILDSIKKIEDR